MATSTETVASLTRRVAGALREAFAADDRAATADLDARLLAGHVLGLDATGMVVHAGAPVAGEDAARAMALAARRAGGEPVARIVGAKGFWNLTLALSLETLVPRPDTETVVAAALAWADAAGLRRTPLSILDLGTGSGAILLALLSELPEATGVGIDRAEGAARTARENAGRNGLGARACFAVADWAAPLAGRFDLVVSNPPYIPRGEIARLPLEVSRFDPNIALDGGDDGLAAYRVILDSLEQRLRPGGAAFLEVGAGQAEGVGTIAASHGFVSHFHRDLAGIDRVVELRRQQQTATKLGLEIVDEPASFASP
ncbi:MAG: peptide chain release factor N(5)-glutamine methyltransferase [Bauldia sp.]|nr:peptide chain release factor N(5)-glutamine methyltransferase [Bauldia sp.]